MRESHRTSRYRHILAVLPTIIIIHKNIFERICEVKAGVIASVKMH